MRTQKRPFKNAQTAAFAAFIFSNIDAAKASRAQFVSEATEGFKYCGANFAEKVDCDCARAEGIDWDAIDEIFQYDLAPVVDTPVAEGEAVADTVTPGSGLPTKTTEVADKIAETIPDLQVLEIGGDNEEESPGYQTTDKSEGGVN